MSKVSLTRLGAVLGIAAGVFIICEAAFAADAVCNGTATSTATSGTGGAMQPVAWANGSFSCAGTCNPGTCAGQQTGDDAGDPKGQTSAKNANCTTTVVTNTECRCPSGAGDAGCREIWEVTVVVNVDGSVGSVTSRMYCFGPCTNPQECEYERQLPAPAGTKKWSCQCK